MCAAQAAGVLLALAVVAVWPGGRPIDPIIALGIAGWSAWEGTGPGPGRLCSPDGIETRRVKITRH